MTKRSRTKRFNNRLPAGTSERFLEELFAALPEDCGTSSSFNLQYLKGEILSKYCDSKTTPPEARRQSAIDKWLLTEARNERTNVRCYENSRDFGWITSEELFSEVRHFISRVLGPLGYPQIFLRENGGHSNGASTRVKRSEVAALIKLTGKVHLSNSASSHWRAMFKDSMAEDQQFELCETSELFTVPKKSDIDRVACKEPEGNMLMQRKIGQHISRRLRKYGIDLRDQTRNQKLAKDAVRLGLATIDLSSASDSITRSVVFNSLPFEWYSLLDDLRVKETLINDEVHTLQMFSSMGNGFTFELESLIFYAVTKVVARRLAIRGTISVFGDDIIAPCAMVPALTCVFGYLGFILNPKKTHSKGLLRESCGAHYHNGFDVSPFYIRREVATIVDLINHLNHVLEWDGRRWGCFMHPDLARFHLKWSRWIPKRLHGGLSTSDPTALVTGDDPRFRLVPVKRSRRYTRQKTRNKLPAMDSFRRVDSLPKTFSSESLISKRATKLPKISALELTEYGDLSRSTSSSAFAVVVLDWALAGSNLSVTRVPWRTKSPFKLNPSWGADMEEASLRHWLMTKRQFDGIGPLTGEDHIELDPSIEVAYEYAPIVSLGERTTWQPYMILHQ